MKAFAVLSLLLTVTALAETPQVEIAARIEGPNRQRSSAFEVFLPFKKTKQTVVLAGPRVTTRSGQRATIEIIRENKIPTSPTGERKINTGMTLDILPVVRNGRIALSGKATLRRLLPQQAPQPLHAISFSTRETYFGGTLQSGQEVTIAVGENRNDTTRLTIQARLVDFRQQKAH